VTTDRARAARRGIVRGRGGPSGPRPPRCRGAGEERRLPATTGGGGRCGPGFARLRPRGTGRYAGGRRRRAKGHGHGPDSRRSRRWWLELAVVVGGVAGARGGRAQPTRPPRRARGARDDAPMPRCSSSTTPLAETCRRSGGGQEGVALVEEAEWSCGPRCRPRPNLLERTACSRDDGRTSATCRGRSSTSSTRLLPVPRRDGRPAVRDLRARWRRHGGLRCTASNASRRPALEAGGGAAGLTGPPSAADLDAVRELAATVASASRVREPKPLPTSSRPASTSVLRHQPVAGVAERGHHFARPGNRSGRLSTWPPHAAPVHPGRGPAAARARAGRDQRRRPATRAAAELTAEELREGAAALAELVAQFRPRVLAVLGITAWRWPSSGRGRSSVRSREVGGAVTWWRPTERPQRPLPAAGPRGRLPATQTPLRGHMAIVAPQSSLIRPSAPAQCTVTTPAATTVSRAIRRLVASARTPITSGQTRNPIRSSS
jgi:TDG/mug DNA glycosylase family protein